MAARPFGGRAWFAETWLIGFLIFKKDRDGRAASRGLARCERGFPLVLATAF
jgi:hypothetical protein